MKKYTWVLLAVLLVGLAGFFWLQKSGKLTGGNPSSLSTIEKSDPGLGISFNLEFSGSYVSLDKAAYLLTLKGNDGKEYRFLVPDSMLMYGDDDILRLQPDQGVKVMWNDSRTMEDVLAEYDNNPTKPLNQGSNSVSITGNYDESQE